MPSSNQMMLASSSFGECYDDAYGRRPIMMAAPAWGCHFGLCGYTPASGRVYELLAAYGYV